MTEAAPATGTDPLLQLQELDLSIDRLRTRHDEIEAGEEARAARARRDEAQNRVGELRLALDSVNLEVRRLENDADGLARKAAAEETRLYDGSVANAKELEAIQHEVANLKARRSRVDDELLDQMLRREELEGQIKTAEDDLAEMERRLTELLGSASTELDDIERSLTARRAEREQLAPTIDPDVLDLYEDLRRQKKGVGAAALIDGVCQGCHQKLSALELDRLKRTSGVRRCEYCRRILVF